MKNSVGSAGFFASLVQSTGKGGKVKGSAKGNISALFGASFLKVTSPAVKGAEATKMAKGPIQISPDILKKLISTADKAEVKEALKKIAGELDKLGESLGIGKEVKAKIEKLLSCDGELDEETLEALLISFVEVLSTLQDMKELITASGLETITLEDGEEVNLAEMVPLLEEVSQNIGKSLQKAGVSPVLVKMAQGDTKGVAQLPETSQLSEKELQQVVELLEKVSKAPGKESKGFLESATVPTAAVAQPEVTVQEEVPAQLTVLLSKLKGKLSKVKRVVAKAQEKQGGKLDALGALKGEESLEKALSEKAITVNSKASKEKKGVLTAKASIHSGLQQGLGERSKVAELLNFSREISQPLLDGDEILQSATDKISQAGKALGQKQMRFTSLAERLFESQIMQQVSSKMSNAVKEGLHVINIKLRPEHLGDVSIKLQIEGDVVTAKINVENQQVKQIIENNFQNLRDSLEEQNLYAGSLDVNVGSESGASFQEYAEEFGFDGQDSYGSEMTEDEALVADEIGLDTGRRFGTNSFEYSA